MKRLFMLAALVFALQACNNENPGESGAVNDGIETVGDDDGDRITDTTTPRVDTLNENRVDIQQRDTVGR